MGQAPLFDGFAFDPFSLLDDGLSPTKVGISKCDVLQALVIALVAEAPDRARMGSMVAHIFRNSGNSPSANLTRIERIGPNPIQ